MRRMWVLVLSVVLPAVALVTTPLPAADAAGSVVRVRLRQAVRQLPEAREVRSGYDRDKFRLWVDADGDCRDTRDEVLADESLVPVSGCDVQRGRWRSWYDGRSYRRSSQLDIDHLVPLAEAWDSGARRWNAVTRERYANDLRDPRTLVAVSASVNRSKGDQDPAEWLPRLAKCRYLRDWVAVKIRWSLTVDRAEKRALTRRAGHCANQVIRVRTARIGRHTSGGGTAGGGTGGATGLDPRFATCTEAEAHGYGPYYQGVDPEYAWYRDADGDGEVCE